MDIGEKKIMEWVIKQLLSAMVGSLSLEMFQKGVDVALEATDQW